MSMEKDTSISEEIISGEPISDCNAKADTMTKMSYDELELYVKKLLRHIETIEAENRSLKAEIRDLILDQNRKNRMLSRLHIQILRLENEIMQRERNMITFIEGEKDRIYGMLYHVKMANKCGDDAVSSLIASERYHRNAVDESEKLISLYRTSANNRIPQNSQSPSGIQQTTAGLSLRQPLSSLSTDHENSNICEVENCFPRLKSNVRRFGNRNSLNSRSSASCNSKATSTRILHGSNSNLEHVDASYRNVELGQNSGQFQVSVPTGSLQVDSLIGPNLRHCETSASALDQLVSSVSQPPSTHSGSSAGTTQRTKGSQRNSKNSQTSSFSVTAQKANESRQSTKRFRTSNSQAIENLKGKKARKENEINKASGKERISKDIPEINRSRTRKSLSKTHKSRNQLADAMKHDKTYKLSDIETIMNNPSMKPKLVLKDVLLDKEVENDPYVSKLKTELSEKSKFKMNNNKFEENLGGRSEDSSKPEENFHHRLQAEKNVYENIEYNKTIDGNSEIGKLGGNSGVEEAYNGTSKAINMGIICEVEKSHGLSDAEENLVSISALDKKTSGNYEPENSEDISGAEDNDKEQFLSHVDKTASNSDHTIEGSPTSSLIKEKLLTGSNINDNLTPSDCHSECTGSSHVNSFEYTDEDKVLFCSEAMPLRFRSRGPRTPPPYSPPKEFQSPLTPPRKDSSTPPEPLPKNGPCTPPSPFPKKDGPFTPPGPPSKKGPCTPPGPFPKRGPRTPPGPAPDTSEESDDNDDTVPYDSSPSIGSPGLTS